MKKLLLALLVVSMACSLSFAGKKSGQIDYKVFELDNGLQVIISEDKSVPIVTVDVWYHVGSGYEKPGRSGFAHLFEHMMFEGSENVADADHSKFINGAGGNDNGSTTEDRTNYYETVPANRLNLALWLEADRMKALNVNSKNFENQREVVKEERRQRVDNQPYSAAFLTSDTLSYDYLPYRHTVIGKMVDLDNATVDDALRFYKKYYVPNNATLVIVGDVKTKDALKMVKKYFGDIPRGEDVEPLTGTEPPHTEPRRKVVDDPNANVPAIFITYNIPETKHEDMPALNTLARILTDGEASRVHKRLVKDEEVAVIVWGGAETRRGPGLFRFIAASNVGVEIEKCEELIYEEIDKLKTEGITDAELEKAKVQMKSDAIRARQTVMGKAETLHHFNYFYDDVSEINKRVDRYAELTKQDILDVANKYLKHEGRTVVICNPAPKQ